MTIEHQYSRFFALTGNEIAAAILTLADSSRKDESLLTVEAAAELLSLKPAGLRKVVKAGKIRHVQNGRGPIKFRREWLDEYLQENNPQGRKRSPTRRPPAPPRSSLPGFSPALFKN